MSISYSQCTWYTVCILLTSFDSTVDLVSHPAESSPGRERRLHDMDAVLKRG